ncbi:serine hydrolase, partial [Streptococcus suis]|nr:serine hydrolase [Streptococcus suis]
RTYAELVDDVIKNPLRLDDIQSYQSVVNHDLVSPMRKNGKLNKINIFNQVSTAYGAGDFFTTPLNFWVLMRSFSKGYFFPTDEY